MTTSGETIRFRTDQPAGRSVSPPQAPPRRASAEAGDRVARLEATLERLEAAVGQLADLLTQLEERAAALTATPSRPVVRTTHVAEPGPEFAPAVMNPNDVKVSLYGDNNVRAVMGQVKVHQHLDY